MRMRRRSSGRVSKATVPALAEAQAVSCAPLPASDSRLDVAPVTALRIVVFVPTALQTVLMRLPPTASETGMPRTFGPTARPEPVGLVPGPVELEGASQKVASPTPAPSDGLSIEHAVTVTV